MNTINEIQNIVEWFRELPSDYTGINELMHQRQRLTGFYALLSAQVGESRAVWAKSKAIYEKKKLQLRVGYLSKGTTKAETISRANSIPELEAQQSAEGLYYEFYFLLKGTEEVLSAMNQQIAHLREELKKSVFQNG